MPSSLARTRPELDEIPLSTVMMTSGRMASAAASYSMAGASPYSCLTRSGTPQSKFMAHPVKAITRTEHAVAPSPS